MLPFKFKISRQKKHGFTLVEILVVIAILAGVVALALPTIINASPNSALVAEVSKIEYSLVAYQQSAFSGKNNLAYYGISFTENEYTLFTGTTSVGSSTDTTQMPLPEGVRISQSSITGGSGDDIVFQKGSLKPIYYGTIDITNDVISYRIDISSEGLIKFSSL